VIGPGGAPVVREVRARAGRLVFEQFPDSIAIAPTTSRFASRILEVWNRVAAGGRGFTPYWRQLSLCAD
jgi:hypothetical protein